MDRFRTELCELGPGLSNHQFHCLKIACCLFLGISRQTLETVTTFIALYELMEQKLPHGADSFIYQILSKLNVSKSKLARIDPYVNRKQKNFILDNPQLDLLLTVAVMMDKLSNGRYQKFRNQCVRSFLIDYHVDNITSRAALLELLADRGLLDPFDLTSLFLLFHHITCTSTDGSAQYINILREFCTRQQIEEPNWTESQLPNNMSDSLIYQLQVEVQLSNSYGSNLRGTVSSNVINQSNVHYKSKGCGFNFNIRRIITYSVFIALFLLICFCLLIGFGLFFTGTYFHQLTNIEANSSHQIGANSIVQLFPGQCINPGWIKSIIITVHSPLILNITVYKGLCTDHPSTGMQYLENKTYSRTQTFYKDLKNYCFNANYNGEKQKEHYPIYTAGHGILSYDIQLMNASKIDESPCPLILYLFNESYYYNYWLRAINYDSSDQQSVAEVAYAYSPCLNTSNVTNHYQNDLFNFKHNFHLGDKGFYYTLSCITTSFFSNLTISGEVTEYSEKEMEVLQSCSLSNAVGDANCTVSMGNFFDSSFSFFVEMNYEPSERNVTVLVTPEKWNIGSVLCLSLTILVIVTSIIIIIVVMSCKQKKKIKGYSALQ